MLLTKLRIQRYRGIRDLSLDSLGRVNLLIGENAAGKTTVLEALALLGSGGRANVIAPVAATRGPEGQVAGPAAIRDLVWVPMFYGLETDTPIAIEANGGEMDSMSLSIRMEPVDELTVPNVQTGEPFAVAVDEALVLGYTHGGKAFESRVVLGPKEMQIAQPTELPRARLAFLPANVGDASQDATKLGALRREKRSAFLLEALRELDPRIRSVEENSSSGSAAIYCDIEGLPRLMSLSSLGGGLARVTRYLLAIATSSGGAVMIDELENGLHHGAMTTAWRAIKTAADRFDTQVFATTHSLECIRAAHQALDEEGIQVTRVERENGTVRAEQYSAEGLSSAIEFSMEMR